MNDADWSAALGGPVDTVDPVGGGDICSAVRLCCGDRTFFGKRPRRPDGRMFAIEASGLRWLAEAVPGLAPGVVAADERALILEWVDLRPPTPAAAEALGRRLAALHRHPAPTFGLAPTPDGRIGSLPMIIAPFPDWPSMFAEARLRPLLQPGMRHTAALVDELAAGPEWAGPAEPPSRLHGDLWSGNVLWAGDTALITDPAAHAGHRETDLAMLALFGCPHLERVLAAYEEDYPLAEGWRQRVALHQIWPLLVHTNLFGGGYAMQAEAAAARYV